MAAALTVTPAQVQINDQVVIDGTGFLPSTRVAISIPEFGVEADVTSDPSGEINGNDLADKAVATLTTTGNAVAAETVTIGAVTYTWRASVTTTANEVLVGANASASLDNLKSAVNADGNTAVYGSLTVANPTVGAGAKTATTLVLYAKTGGTAGNSLASTETMTNASFGGTTFAGGAVATTINPLVFVPTEVRPFTVKATDGTNSASITVPVWTE
jgi:hypothetical protein